MVRQSVTCTGRRRATALQQDRLEFREETAMFHHFPFLLPIRGKWVQFQSQSQWVGQPLSGSSKSSDHVFSVTHFIDTRVRARGAYRPILGSLESFGQWVTTHRKWRKESKRQQCRARHLLHLLCFFLCISGVESCAVTLYSVSSWRTDPE